MINLEYLVCLFEAWNSLMISNISTFKMKISILGIGWIILLFFTIFDLKWFYLGKMIIVIVLKYAGLDCGSLLEVKILYFI